MTLGHREIVFVGGPERLRSAFRRLEALRNLMRRHLLPVRARFYRGDF